MLSLVFVYNISHFKHLKKWGKCFSRLVREFVISDDPAKIRRILKILGEDFALSNHPNARKGGSIGLAATAIGLGKVRRTRISQF